jgi:glycosyltransferase involved in cell wall biosynthesis
MRIAYITADPGVPVFGRKGCSIHVQEMLRAMLKCGGQIDLFAANCTSGPPPDLAAVSLHRFMDAPKGDLATREQKCLAANQALRAALEAAGPFGFVYERYSLWSFAGMEYAQESATAGVLEVNAPLIEEQTEHRGLIDLANAERVARRAFNAAKTLIAVSEEVADHLECFAEAQGKINVVPNAVNPEHYPLDIRPSSLAPPGTFTVGFVGSMKPWHGVDKLLEAFSRFYERFPESRLLLVGEGPEREQLVADAESRGLARAVQFTGAVKPCEVPALLASMDVAVAPYPKLANFYFSPLKVYEYMAAGRPIVASRVGQLEKLLESEITGLLVAPGDVAALTGALTQIRSEPAMAQRLGKAARTKVMANHTWDAAFARILALARSNSREHVLS